jgi:hypothetical protein
MVLPIFEIPNSHLFPQREVLFWEFFMRIAPVECGVHGKNQL